MNTSSLKSDVQEHSKAANISKRQEVKFEYDEFFIDRFPALKADKDVVQLEFLRYQVELLPECELSSEREDVAWRHISQLRYSNGKHKELGAIVKGILVIPHSNADSERVFSCVRKNRTEFRPPLSESTLESLLVEKNSMFASGKVCHNQTYSTQLIRKAKSATYTSLTTSASQAQGGDLSLHQQ